MQKAEMGRGERREQGVTIHAGPASHVRTHWAGHRNTDPTSYTAGPPEKIQSLVSSLGQLIWK